MAVLGKAIFIQFAVYSGVKCDVDVERLRMWRLEAILHTLAVI